MVNAQKKAEIDRDNLETELEVVEAELVNHDATPLDAPTVDNYISLTTPMLPELKNLHQIISHHTPTDIDDQTLKYKDLTRRILKANSKLKVIKLAFPPTVNPTAFTSASSSAGAVSCHLKLPRIELPVFQGKYEDWPSFADLFIATVDKNPTLSGAQKLQYLRSYLRGDAETLVKSFTITDSHYSEAWTLLSDRYNNKREIIHSLCKRLLFQPNIKSEGATHIQSLVNVTNECIRSLKVQGTDTDFWEDLLVVIMSEKLDPSTKAEWAKQLKGTRPPTLKELQEFLEQHIRSLHARGIMGNKPTTSNPPRIQTSSHHVGVTTAGCMVCNQPHPIYKCEQFLNLSASERGNLITKASACRNCLRKGHNANSCSSKFTCKKCHKPHNTLLHFERRPAPGGSSQPSSSSSSTENTSSTTNSLHTSMMLCAHTQEHKTQVLLKTALVSVKDSSGQSHNVRVLFDDCSESSFISERCVSALGLHRQPTSVEVKGISAASIMNIKTKVFVQLSSIVHQGTVAVEAYVLNKVTGALPRFKCNPSEWSHIKDIQLADPHFHTPGDIDMLLGADIVAAVIREGIRRGPKFSPLAQNSLFGWVLSGKVATSDPLVIHTHHTTIENILQKFWTLEEVPETSRLTVQEQLCEEHFKATHFRQQSGRYGVHLPFNDKVHTLGESRQLALQRLFQLERRFTRNPECKQQYVDFMREYHALGHMQLVSEPSVNPRAVYLPHHFVKKEDSTSTKLRVVYDASAKTSSGVSLNDTLLVGPTVQSDLFTLLLKFRFHLIALKADITKMYRQFLVHEKDADYQRIVWRESSDQPVKDFRLLTVTYGTASAPYLATRCLQQLAFDGEKKYPLASSIIQEDMYVDDMMSGADTIPEAVQLYEDLTNLCTDGEMQIRKWATNDPEVLKHIPSDLRETDLQLDFDDDATIKALGVRWNPVSDNFTFSVHPNSCANVTKRQLLSQLAKVFDPLGWLTPVTVTAKLIFQQLWKYDCGWDDIITGELQQQWSTYQSQLSVLSNITIPRCIKIPAALNYQLHGFSDSSQRALAACLYLRCESSDGHIQINLMAARSKVAPLKPQCIHRLELCGALLLAELIDCVKTTIKFPVSVFAWSDSMITIKWLSSHPSRWKTFVANRVAKIQELVPTEHWHHVRGIDNPADAGSRGISPIELVNSNLWWSGPGYLMQNEYPIQLGTTDIPAVKKEERAKPVFTAATSVSQPFNLISKFSSFSKLKRVTAYCIRFIHNCKSKLGRKYEALTSAELLHAEKILIRNIQAEMFIEEINSLKKKQEVANNSKTKQLYPFIDGDGLLRVGGRLERAAGGDNKRHPIILPHSHHFTTIIIQHYHQKYLHSGLTLTLANLSQKYWVIRARDTVRHLIRKCIICRRNRATLCQQLMGSLPSSRINPSRPFQHVGVDFAGPYQIKLVRKRSVMYQKSYFCIFVCFATKAVHLEVVLDMSAESFLATFKRFVSRRGFPSDVHSDCGTNFVGAEKELKAMYNHVRANSVYNEFAGNGVTWHFNTPSSPHQGGIFEAGVKSVKYHLRRVVGTQNLTLEQFQTLLCSVEACLNSRPLCALSSDPTDLEALTPGHFLIGTALTAVPEPDATELPFNSLSYWQQVQQLTQRFWKRWSAEYVTTLQQRFKWVSKRSNLQINDLVIIKDESLPPTKWKMGRIMEAPMSTDGCVRTVVLKTSTGLLKRPIVKLCAILFQNES